MSKNRSGGNVPAAVRWAGSFVCAEGSVAVVVAVIFVVRGLFGEDQSIASGYGTAAWFAVLGAAVVTGGVALIRGQRWGRAIAIVAQLLLLPVAWSLLTDSHQPVYGTVLAVVVVATLALLFSPPAAQWMAREYGDDQLADHD